jgi:hypothetical protein
VRPWTEGLIIDQKAVGVLNAHGFFYGNHVKMLNYKIKIYLWIMAGSKSATETFVLVWG